MPTVDYLPVATGGSANVVPQADFAGAGFQENGFTAGVAQSAQSNKVWRQSSMVAAMIATFIANTLSIDVLDDGNLSNLLANFEDALADASNILGTANTFTQEQTIDVHADPTKPNPLLVVGSNIGATQIEISNTTADEWGIASVGSAGLLGAPAGSLAFTHMPGVLAMYLTATGMSLRGSQVLTGVQGTSGTKLQVAAGSFNPQNLTMTDGNGNLVDSGVPATNGTPGTMLVSNGTTWVPRVFTLHDQTGSRAFNTPFTNGSGGVMKVTGWGVTGGSSTGSITVTVGGVQIWQMEYTATVASAAAGFAFDVPAGATYQVNTSGTVGSLGKWVEGTWD